MGISALWYINMTTLADKGWKTSETINKKGDFQGQQVNLPRGSVICMMGYRLMMMGLYYPKKKMPETSKWAMAAKPQLADDEGYLLFDINSSRIYSGFT